MLADQNLKIIIENMITCGNENNKQIKSRKSIEEVQNMGKNHKIYHIVGKYIVPESVGTQSYNI